MGVSKLMDLLSDSREIIRNEVSVFIQLIMSNLQFLEKTNKKTPIFSAVT